MDRGASKLHRCALLLRNLLIALLAYISVFGVVHLCRTGSISPFSKAPLKRPVLPEGSLSGGIDWRLRPETIVAGIDDAYLGKRPHVDTFANHTLLLEACRGSSAGLEKMRRVHDCLTYLSEMEKDYYFIPSPSPSKSSPDYPSIEHAEKPSIKGIGGCPGPIQLYHTYWTGPSTWRVELFIKSYLYTQNLACSRLYIWLDSDTNPNAVKDMMMDSGFERFLPLAERGDITLMAWKFPSRIPLPKGTIEKDPLYSGYLSEEGKIVNTKNSKGEIVIGDGLVVDVDGSEWLVLTERQMTFLPVAISDALRFVVLHLYGGVYLDMDILLLRDMRPLLLTPDHNFAERWAVHTHPGDFNTAVMSLNANSSLSSYLLRGGVRMGLNFHPRIIGRMAWKDGRVEEFVMFETGLFDPIWGEFNWGREGRCTVPCFKDYGVAFLGTRDAIKDEWQSYDGVQLPLKEEFASIHELRRRTSDGLAPARNADLPRRGHPDLMKIKSTTDIKTVQESSANGLDGTYGGQRYHIENDKYPPNNRTMSTFFRGAWTYHIHNQVSKEHTPKS
jgi:hypothetical protein